MINSFLLLRRVMHFLPLGLASTYSCVHVGLTANIINATFKELYNLS